MNEKQKAEFLKMAERTLQSGKNSETEGNMEPLYDIPVQVTAVLGKTTLTVSQLLKMGPGSILELDKQVGDSVDIYVNNHLIARGELVQQGDRLGITMTEIVKS